MKWFVPAAVLAFFVASAAAAQERDAPATPEAREAMAEFARCVASRSPDKTRATLRMDFTTSAYRQSLRALADTNRDCLRGRATLRAGGLPFAAALAEALIHDRRQPLNVRLVRAATVPAPTYAPSDRIAMCVARSDADNTAALLLAPIASGAETGAAKALGVAVHRCSAPRVRVDLDQYALRAILATASFRLLTAAEVAQ